MNAGNLKNFHIVSHTHRLSEEGGGRVGYHCPDCKCFYAEGNFTIENATHVLGNANRKNCCGKNRPTPLLFETIEEIMDFILGLETSSIWTKATLIKKSALDVAHFNWKLVVEQKQKVLN